MIEKEMIISDQKIRDSYVQLQLAFCEEFKIDQNTLIDSGDWYQKFIEWQDTHKA